MLMFGQNKHFVRIERIKSITAAQIQWIIYELVNHIPS